MSKTCIGVFLLLIIVIAAGLPAVIDGIVSRRHLDILTGKLFFLFSFYSLLLPAVTALAAA